MSSTNGLVGNLASMREGADEIERRALTIRQALEAAQGILNTILPSIESDAAEEFKFFYRSQSGSMQELPNQLQQFAKKLRSASDAIENAARSKSGNNREKPTDSNHDGQQTSQQSQPNGKVMPSTIHGHRPFDASQHNHAYNNPASNNEIKDKLIQFKKPAYISDDNKPLYKEFNEKQGQFITEQQKFDMYKELYATRLKYLRDLQAASPNATNDINRVASEIEQMKKALILQQSTVTDLMHQASALLTRVERVTPGAGANISGILSMANSQTSQQILDNTGSCVHYIAQRMSVPFAPNAYEWNDWVKKNGALYGIKEGNIPLAGSVIVMEQDHPYASEVYGHVLYVEKVDVDGTVWITDNNHSEMVKLTSLTHEITGPNIHYLYFPWETKG